MIILDEQIKTIVKEIEEVSDYLYQQNYKKGYEAFNLAIEKLLPLIDGMGQMMEKRPDIFDIQGFLLSLNKAFEAMQNKDNVLLADILVFEINEQLKMLISK